LVGVQVPQEENDALLKFLDELDYAYCEETANPAYRLFLG
jgi:threonine dehydratase